MKGRLVGFVLFCIGLLNQNECSAGKGFALSERERDVYELVKWEGSRIYRKRQPVAKPIRRRRTRKSSRIFEKVLDALMTEPIIRQKVNKQ